MKQYFEENKELKEERKTIKFQINQTNYKLITTTGMFSKDKLDYGTKLLIETILKYKPTGKILDLGCGYGPIGIVLAKELPNSTIHMTDITSRAIKTTKQNIKNYNLKNIKVFKSNIYEKIFDDYDIIITNPPIRVGKKTIKKFLFEAETHLQKKGTLYFVMRKNHGVKSMLEELQQVYNVETLTKSKGFYVIKCQIK